MTVQAKDLWALVRGQPQLDASELAEAVRAEVHNEPLDYRTRLLIRESIDALRTHWGGNRLDEWLASCPEHEKLAEIWRQDFDETGFPSLSERLMEKTDPSDVRQFLRDLGSQVQQPLKMVIGGSIALILTGHVTRSTDDIDVVDEVPAEIRSLHPVVEELRKRYGLLLTHFQSHYLPSGWESRLQSLGAFGKLQVSVVDPIDIFLCKLFSRRPKDVDDLRVLARQFDKDDLVRRLRDTTVSLRSDAGLRGQAEHNWYVLYGEPLPT